MSELKVGAVNRFNFAVLHSISLFALNFNLHSISLFCTDLGLIDMLLTNQNAEIVACILLSFENLVLRVSSRFPNTHSVQAWLEPQMIHEARVSEMSSQTIVFLK